MRTVCMCIVCIVLCMYTIAYRVYIVDVVDVVDVVAVVNRVYVVHIHEGMVMPAKTMTRREEHHLSMDSKAGPSPDAQHTL